MASVQTKYFAAHVRIADEVQKNLNLAAWLREGLENALGASYGVGNDGSPPKCGVDTKQVQAWRDVVKAVEALVACKIKLDANAKKMADEMTPEDELKAVRSYIRSLEPTVAVSFLREETEWRDAH